MFRRSRSLGKLVVALASLAACTSATGSTQTDDSSELRTAPGSRFVDVKEKIYAQPLSTLPQHMGLNLREVALNLIGSESKPNHGLGVRSRRTLVDESDERPAEPKWLHPRGACAEARWKITEDAGGTGLFEIGVDVPAIVRVSSGQAASLGGEEAGGRILGMAIKLFPTTSETQKVKTRNIVMLDRYGFEGSSREHTLVENDGQPVYFTNVAPATSTLGRFLSQFFDRFDNPNWARPLYGVARAYVGGSSDLIRYRTPYEIRLQATAGTRGHDAADKDFRTELVETAEPIRLDIILQSWRGTDVAAQKIGSLDFGKFVVSDYCDLSLHFHHDAQEDQFEKYDDYEVVKDLMPE